MGVIGDFVARFDQAIEVPGFKFGLAFNRSNVNGNGYSVGGSVGGTADKRIGGSISTSICTGCTSDSHIEILIVMFHVGNMPTVDHVDVSRVFVFEALVADSWWHYYFFLFTCVVALLQYFDISIFQDGSVCVCRKVGRKLGADKGC